MAACLILAALLVIGRREGWWRPIGSWMSSHTGVRNDLRDHDIDPQISKVLALADNETHAGQFANAESRLRALLIDAERSHGPNSVEVGLTLTALVDVMVRRGQAKSAECLELAERSVRLMESARDPRLAESLDRKAAVLRERGQLRDAQACLEQAEAFQRAYALPDTNGVTQGLAAIYTQLGLYDDARAILERKIDADSARHMSPRELVYTRYTLAQLLVKMGDYSAAKRIFDEALASAEGPLERAFLLNSRANLHEELGEYPQAQALYERAMADAEEVGPDNAIVGSILNNLGYVHRKMGQYPKAREYLESARDFYRKAYGEDSPLVATAMGNLADVQCLEGNYEDAEKLYLRALHLREELVGREHPTVASSLNRLGELYLKTGRPNQAVPLFERALAIHVQHRHVDKWESLAGLAKARDELGDREAAGKLYEEALAAIKTVAGSESARCVPAMRDLAWFQDRTGREPDGLALAMAAETLSMEHARLMASALPDEQAMRYAMVRAEGLPLVLSIAVTDRSREVAERVWDVTVQSRALVLDEIADRRRALRFDDPETQRIAAAYQAASQRLAHLLLVGQGSGNTPLPAQLAEARHGRERCERELAAHSAAFKAMDTGHHIGLAEVRAALPTESGLVAFVRYQRWSPELGALGADESAIQRGKVDQEYLAFVLPAPGAPAEVVPLGKAAPIDSLVNAWSRAIERAPVARDRAAARAAYREAGSALRKVLWDPIADRLGSARTVFVVPDGEIHRVSLAVLPTGSDRYLIETGPRCHYLVAERDLVTGTPEQAGSGPRAGATKGRGLLAVGGAAFDGAPRTPGSGVLPHFAPLLATAEEARSVTAMWERTMAGSRGQGSLARPVGAAQSTGVAPGDAVAILLTGEDATEGEVKKQAPGRRVLHLATHGFFLAEGSRLLPGTRGWGGIVTDSAKAPDIPAMNPLQLSGLAFAGANHAQSVRPDEEDGILTAEEIAAMNLTGVEWAVLSACETGVGSVQDVEGIVGLRRAFQVAGVRTLIMSLWPVDDRATQAWMEELYRHRLEDRESTLEAVHEATLSVLLAERAAGREHPFFWGAFVAAGDWR